MLNIGDYYHKTGGIMELTIENRGEVAIVAVNGRLDASSAGELQKQFDKLLDKTKFFVFDLAQMDFVDSTGLGKLVACLKKATEMDGGLKLCGLQPKPRMVFEITKAYTVFDIYDDVDAAVESY